MIAIVTKYLGPTNTLPSRVRASVPDKTIVLPWDHGVSVEGNHARVALSLARSLGWGGPWYSGSMPGPNMVFVRGNTIPYIVEN